LTNDSRPKCILITGRPGSGKTTLSAKLSERLYLPRLSRDRFKEGYVNTFNMKHDSLPKETNGIVNEVFFEVVITMLKGKVSLVIEAAFQHKNWNLVVPSILEIADLRILICDLDSETSARRHLERGLANPKREFYHGDKRVAVYRQTGHFAPGGKYDPPIYDVPTLCVNTKNGYDPGIEVIEKFITSAQQGGEPDAASRRQLP